VTGIAIFVSEVSFKSKVGQFIVRNVVPCCAHTALLYVKPAMRLAAGGVIVVMAMIRLCVSAASPGLVANTKTMRTSLVLIVMVGPDIAKLARSSVIFPTVLSAVTNVKHPVATFALALAVSTTTTLTISVVSSALARSVPIVMPSSLVIAVRNALAPSVPDVRNKTPWNAPRLIAKVVHSEWSPFRCANIDCSARFCRDCNWALSDSGYCSRDCEIAVQED
jgi:hypothetical protein